MHPGAVRRDFLDDCSDEEQALSVFHLHCKNQKIMQERGGAAGRWVDGHREARLMAGMIERRKDAIIQWVCIQHCHGEPRQT